jgi:methyl coenzyme M reductase subunit C-like uncharacterized protein (methanogenesis marker protein 7)
VGEYVLEVRAIEFFFQASRFPVEEYDVVCFTVGKDDACSEDYADDEDDVEIPVPVRSLGDEATADGTW